MLGPPYSCINTGWATDVAVPSASSSPFKFMISPYISHQDSVGQLEKKQASQEWTSASKLHPRRRKRKKSRTSEVLNLTFQITRKFFNGPLVFVAFWLSNCHEPEWSINGQFGVTSPDVTINQLKHFTEKPRGYTLSNFGRMQPAAVAKSSARGKSGSQ